MNNFWISSGVLQTNSGNSDMPICPLCGQEVDTGSIVAVLHHAELGHRRMTEPEAVVLTVLEPAFPVGDTAEAA